MSLLKEQNPEGVELKVSPEPQKDSGVGLAFDQFGGPSQKIPRPLYGNPVLDPSLVLAEWLGREDLWFGPYALEVFSGASVDFGSAEELEFQPFDFVVSSGASQELEQEDIEFELYPIGFAPILQDGPYTFVTYDPVVTVGSSVVLDWESLDFETFDIDVDAIPPLKLTFIGCTGQAGSGTLAAPSGQAGDILIFIGLRTNAVAANPTGFTSLVSQSDGSVSLRVSVKTTTTANEGVDTPNFGGWLLRFRPNKAVSSISPSTWTVVVTSNNPAPQLVASSALSPPMIVFGGIRGAEANSSASAFSIATPAFAAEFTTPGNNKPRLGYKYYGPGDTPVDHIVDMNDLGTQVLYSGAIIFT